jgi:hypothetical protein
MPAHRFLSHVVLTEGLARIKELNVANRTRQVQPGVSRDSSDNCCTSLRRRGNSKNKRTSDKMKTVQKKDKKCYVANGLKTKWVPALWFDNHSRGVSYLI